MSGGGESATNPDRRYEYARQRLGKVPLPEEFAGSHNWNVVAGVLSNQELPPDLAVSYLKELYGSLMKWSKITLPRLGPHAANSALCAGIVTTDWKRERLSVLHNMVMMATASRLHIGAPDKYLTEIISLMKFIDPDEDEEDNSISLFSSSAQIAMWIAPLMMANCVLFSTNGQRKPCLTMDDHPEVAYIAKMMGTCYLNSMAHSSMLELELYSATTGLAKRASFYLNVTTLQIRKWGLAWVQTCYPERWKVNHQLNLCAAVAAITVQSGELDLTPGELDQVGLAWIENDILSQTDASPVLKYLVKRTDPSVYGTVSDRGPAVKKCEVTMTLKLTQFSTADGSIIVPPNGPDNPYTVSSLKPLHRAVVRPSSG